MQADIQCNVNGGRKIYKHGQVENVVYWPFGTQFYHEAQDQFHNKLIMKYLLNWKRDLAVVGAWYVLSQAPRLF